MTNELKELSKRLRNQFETKDTCGCEKCFRKDSDIRLFKETAETIKKIVLENANNYNETIKQIEEALEVLKK